MADVRPLRALRFAPGLDLASVICPPFDVISPQEQQALHDRSPYNIVRIESPLGDGDPALPAGRRYQRAADTLQRWLREGILRRDESPAFYVYDQQFDHGGRLYRRRALFARVRLEPWEAGLIRPHERTLEPPKEDRLRLLRAVGVNTSPVLALYQDADKSLGPLVDVATASEPIANFGDLEGQRHTLWRLDAGDAIQRLADGFGARTRYIADGHHRYETALAYREERRACAQRWTGEEPENFVLMALTAADDPGLLLLPIHRLVRSDVALEDALAALAPIFDLEATPSLQHLLSLMAQRGKLLTAIGMAAADSPNLYLLSTLNLGAVAAFMPGNSPPQWLNIDTAVLQYAVLGHALGINETTIAEGDVVPYAEDAEAALLAVRQGRFRYAFFLNPIRPDQILAIADAGHRLPQKSTYFFPKLPTGLVLNPLEIHE